MHYILHSEIKQVFVQRMGRLCATCDIKGRSSSPRNMRDFTRHRSVGREGRKAISSRSVDRSIDRPSDRRLRIVHAMVAVVAVRGDEEGRGRRQSRKRLAGERTMDAKGRSVGRHTIDR